MSTTSSTTSSSTADTASTAGIDSPPDSWFEAIIAGLPDGMPTGEPVELAKRVELAKSTAKTAARLPTNLASRALKVVGEHVRIVAGVSDVEPGPRDRRFNDEAFTTNPIYKRMAQSYLAWTREVGPLLDGLDLDQRTRLQADFLAGLVTEALAPTNHLLGNPAALRKAVETKGLSLVEGFRNAYDDLVNNGGMPLMVDSDPYVPGETTATTPGSVVFKNPILELIQYEPTTAKVHKRPLLITPPQINKYYILDLAPGRSLVEHAVSQGHQVFMISWRNPGPQHRDWDLDDYVRSILEASDAVMEITGSEQLNLLGVCAGGMTNAAALAHLAAIGDKRIGSASFLVSVIDWSKPSTLGSMLTGPAVELMKGQSAASGMLAGDDLGKIFAWLRPNDLVWNYWVNNYLMGEKPAPFDVLAWNTDATNLPAGLHHDFLDMASKNSLTEAGAVEVLGTPIDLAQITCPVFVVGAVTDHITPWQGCYQTVNLVGGESEFVLSSQGHIQALVNPSGNPKGSYHLNPATPDDADQWLAEASKHSGSWWDYWATWLEPKGGRLVNPPKSPGSAKNPATVAAPGEYLVEPRPRP